MRGQSLPVGWMMFTEIQSASVRSLLPPEQSLWGQMMRNLPGHMLSTGNTSESPNGVSTELSRFPHLPCASQRHPKVYCTDTLTMLGQIQRRAGARGGWGAPGCPSPWPA